MKITYSKHHRQYIASELGNVIATECNLDALLDRLNISDDEKPIEVITTPQQDGEIQGFLDSLDIL